jgi:hypothetical protein
MFRILNGDRISKDSCFGLKSDPVGVCSLFGQLQLQLLAEGMKLALVSVNRLIERHFDSLLLVGKSDFRFAEVNLYSLCQVFVTHHLECHENVAVVLVPVVIFIDVRLDSLLLLSYSGWSLLCGVFASFDECKLFNIANKLCVLSLHLNLAVCNLSQFIAIFYLRLTHLLFSLILQFCSLDQAHLGRFRLVVLQKGFCKNLKYVVLLVRSLLKSAIKLINSCFCVSKVQQHLSFN